MLGLTVIGAVCVLSFYAMSRTPPRYPRIVHRPSEPDRWEVRDAYGGRIGVYKTEAEAVARLAQLPFRGTTFGRWWEQRREERERR